MAQTYRHRRAEPSDEGGHPMKDSTTPLPAPAGEPDMPEPVAYWWSPKDAGMAGTWSSNTGPHPDWDITRYFTADQLRAYGDARAEHARRVALESVKFHRQASHISPDFRDCFNATIDQAIRAAAPPQGEQT